MKPPLRNGGWGTRHGCLLRCPRQHRFSGATARSGGELGEVNVNKTYQLTLQRGHRAKRSGKMANLGHLVSIIFTLQRSHRANAGESVLMRDTGASGRNAVERRLEAP